MGLRFSRAVIRNDFFVTANVGSMGLLITCCTTCRSLSSASPSTLVATTVGGKGAKRRQLERPNVVETVAVTFQHDL